MSVSQGMRDYLIGAGEPHNFLVGLLTISHEDPEVMSGPLRLNWLTDRAIISRGDKFFPSGFDLLLPSAEDGETSTTLSLPLTNQSALLAVAAAATPFELKLELALTGTPDAVEWFYNFRDSGRQYRAAAQVLVVELRYRDVLLNPRPRRRYLPTSYPALFHAEVEA